MATAPRSTRSTDFARVADALLSKFKASRRNGLPPSETIRTQIGETVEEHTRLTAVRAQLVDEARTLMLSESAEATETRDAQLVEVERDISRLELMREGLERELTAAIAAEKRAGIDALIREGHEIRSRSLQLRDRYAKLAGELATVLGEMRAGYRRFDELRRPVQDAGRLDDLCPGGETSIYDAIAHIVPAVDGLKLVHATRDLPRYWPRRVE